ncbi:MAG: hypothetical protein ACXVNQ_03290 [Bacteroidia bacterium]
MKKLITTVALSLFATTFCLGQDNVTVKMNVKVEGLPPEYAGFGEQEIVNYMKGEKTKTEMTSMMGSNVTVFDGKKLTSISEQMGNKSGYTATKEEIDADKGKDKEAKPKIEYTADKKMIAGYECSKAIVTSIGKDKKENKMTVWVTDKIKSPETGKANRRNGMMDLSELKGYPLEMEMAANQMGTEMKVMITTSEVSTSNIDDSVFSVSTDGYKMLTYAEHKEAMKKAMAEAAGK